jgi:putative PIN family toxin of toxin-antitoxin system
MLVETTTTGSNQTPLVLDTNIVLDLWIFEDPKTNLLRQLLTDKQVRWIATSSMRDELDRVLLYPNLLKRCLARKLEPAELLDRYDQHVDYQQIAARAPYICKDADDQKFIDLAVAHQAWLISKDAQVLRMKNRLARLKVVVSAGLGQ